jgi:hypothetical protein
MHSAARSASCSPAASSTNTGPEPPGKRLGATERAALPNLALSVDSAPRLAEAPSWTRHLRLGGACTRYRAGYKPWARNADGRARCVPVRAGNHGDSRSRVDQLVGLDGVRADIAVARTPDGRGRVELSAFHTPVATSIAPRAPMNTPGMPRLKFVVDAVDDVLDPARRSLQDQPLSARGR